MCIRDRFTSFPVASMATTFSATNSVTDSSAAGTALATGAKTYNGALGMDDNKSVRQRVAERAKKLSLIHISQGPGVSFRQYFSCLIL